MNSNHGMQPSSSVDLVNTNIASGLTSKSQQNKETLQAKQQDTNEDLQ